MDKKREIKKVSSMTKKVFLTILIALATKMSISAEEIFNKPIVEAFSQMIGRSEFYFAGVDVNNDGFADLFIAVPDVNRFPLYRRLANFLREGATVSFDDARKSMDPEMGMIMIDVEHLLEINGRSVLLIFPGDTGEFPVEKARQVRLQNQSN